MRHVGQSEMGNKGWSTNPCCGTLCITTINFSLCIHLGKNGATLKSTECCFHTCCYEKRVKMILMSLLWFGNLFSHGFYFSKQSKKSKQEAIHTNGQLFGFESCLSSSSGFTLGDR